MRLYWNEDLFGGNDNLINDFKIIEKLHVGLFGVCDGVLQLCVYDKEGDIQVLQRIEML